MYQYFIVMYKAEIPCRMCTTFCLCNTFNLSWCGSQLCPKCRETYYKVKTGHWTLWNNWPLHVRSLHTVVLIQKPAGSFNYIMEELILMGSNDSGTLLLPHGRKRSKCDVYNIIVVSARDCTWRRCDDTTSCLISPYMIYGNTILA